jgi:hypothetical protein
MNGSASGKVQSIIVNHSIRCSAPFKVQEFNVQSRKKFGNKRGGGGVEN